MKSIRRRTLPFRCEYWGKNLKDIEIRNRIAMYIRYVSIMHPLLEDRFVPRDCKVIIYRSILNPFFLFEYEIWSLTSKTASNL